MNNKRSARRRPAGYSMPELLAVVAVAGVLAAVGLPTLGALMKDSRRTAVANELLATLQLARSEVIKQGRAVVVCGFDDANANRRLEPAEQACAGRDWGDGWFAAHWSDTDHDQQVDAAELTGPPLALFVNTSGLSVLAPAFATGPAPAGTAILRPFNAQSSNGTIAICDSRGTLYARTVIISPNGRPRVSALRPDRSNPACR